MKQSVLFHLFSTADEYRHKGIWSSGACPDPKWLREKLTIPLEDMVKAVTVYYKNESPRNLSFDEMKKRKYYFDEDYGQCYFLATLPPNGVRVKVEILREALLYMDTPGLFVEYSEPIILETGRNGHYTINLEVVHALDYLGKECYEQNQGNYDFCVMNEIDQHLLNKVGCTTPFGLDMNNICRNQTFGAKAYNIMDYFHDRNHEGIDCKHPCSYLQAKSTEPAIEELYEASNGKASFNLPMKVRVYRSHYSFTGLSFVAEVGGYVGLFLGANFLQFSDLLMLLVRRYY